MEYHHGEPLQNIGMITTMAADRYRDRTALSFMGVEKSYDELEAEANQLANGLVELGVEPGDRVALYIPNEPLFPVAYYGIIKTGAIAVPLNLRMDPDTLVYVLDDSDVDVMISSAYIPEDEPGIAWPVDLAEQAGVETLLMPGRSDEDRGVRNYSHLMADQPSEFDIVDRDYDDVAAQPYTSGTTGKPKGVMLSHENLLSAIESYDKSGLGIDADFTLVLVLPLFHIYALNALMSSFLARGGHLDLQPRPEAESLLGAIDQYDAEVFAGVPALYTQMFRTWREDPEAYDLSSLEYVVCAAAPLAEEVRKTIQEEWGVVMIEGWGMTETSPAGTIEPVAGVRKEAGCVGPAVPGVDLKIVDPETRETRVHPDDIEPFPSADIDFDDEESVTGELAIRGDSVFTGYHGRPEKTEAVFDDDGWFYTGDIARVDEDGYFWIVDRADDMILSGGNNIYPAEVEDALYEHPDVAEAAVVAAPHEVKGEAPVAFVVCEEGSEATEADLRKFALEHVASYAHPRRVFFVDELPRSATQKVQRFKLTAEAEERIGGDLEPSGDQL
jgi:long-chain acyl-CoA synthetase